MFQLQLISSHTYVHRGFSIRTCIHLICVHWRISNIIAEILLVLQVPQFNSSVGTILYTSIQYKLKDNSVVTKRSLDRLYSTSERTVHNTTSVIIRGLSKGSTYIFIICLGNKEGKGPCEEVEITTPKTGNADLPIKGSFLSKVYVHLCVNHKGQNNLYTH